MGGIGGTLLIPLLAGLSMNSDTIGAIVFGIFILVMIFIATRDI